MSAFVRYIEVSVTWRCPLYGGVPYMEVQLVLSCTSENCPLYGGDHY